MKNFLIPLFNFLFVGFIYSQTYTWADASSDNSFGQAIAKDNSGNIFIAEINNSGISVIKYDKFHSINWKRTISSVGINHLGAGICTDNAGSVYITSVFNDDLLLDSNLLISLYGGNMFLIKFNSEGIFQWVKHTTGGQCWGRKVSSDAQNNVYVAGNINGNVYFDSTFISSPVHFLFVAKYNSDGELIWVKHTSGTSFSGWGMGMKTDASGNTYLTGTFKTYTAYFDSISLQPYGFDDVYIAKLDSAGHWLWAKHAGGIYQDAIYYGDGLSLDGNGNLYINGFLGSSPAHFGNITVTGINGDDYFLAKYDTSGNALWVRKDVYPGSQFGYGVAADKEGVYFSKSGTFLMRYDSDGNFLWEDNKPVSNIAMLADGFGSVYITGAFSGTVSFGNFTLNNNGEQMYVAKLRYSIPHAEINTVKDSLLYLAIEKGNHSIEEFSIYPSPAGNKITVSYLSVNKEDECKLRIRNTSGKIVYSQNLPPVQAGIKEPSFTKEIDVGTLSKGIYFLEIIHGKEVAVKKFVRL